MKDLFKNRPVGFYVTISTIGVTLLTAIAYILCYAGSNNFNAGAFILLLVSFVISVVLLFVKQTKFIPYVLWFVNFVAFLFYILGIYRYVADVFIGIDYYYFEPSFYITVILFLLSVVGGTSTIFLKQEKKGEAN